MSPVAQIELAIVQRLRTVQRPYAGLQVESYAAQLDDEMFTWVRTMPAVWVTFGQAQEVKRTGARSFLVSGTFEVLSAQRALEENERRLKPGSAGDSVGVYQIVEDNKLALVNQTLGLEIQALTPGAIRPVMKSIVNRDAIAVYSQEFKTQWMEIYPDPEVEPGATLITVGLDYLLKPGDNTPDSSDTLTTRTT